MYTILENIKNELVQKSCEATRNGAGRFFKEEIKLYGVKSNIVSKIGKEYFKEIKNKPKSEIYGLCTELWKSGIIEECFIACNWSYYINNSSEKSDIEIFESWITKYVNNWATCDTLCNHTIGSFVEKFTESIPKLEKWASSQNRWLKRASAVSLIIPARKGIFLDGIFKIADILLLDKDDLVQKGYGWMLKAASQAHQQEVFNYVHKNKNIMPRTALRYAIEKMPKELKDIALGK